MSYLLAAVMCPLASVDLQNTFRAMVLLVVDL
jgi:hypothetical protein